MATKVLYEGVVLTAAAPAEGWGGDKSKTWVAYRDEQGTLRKAHGEKRLEKEHWLLKGMHIQIAVDPRKPDRCDLITDNVPRISDLIARNDPLVWDTAVIASQLANLHQEIDSTQAGLPFILNPVDVAAERRRMAEGRPSERVVGPDGRLRGTADVLAATPSPHSSEGSVTRWKGRRLVRIWPYGMEPYAFLEKKHFNSNDKVEAFHLGNVPCSINPSDRGDVVYLWDEHDRSKETFQQGLIETALYQSERQMAPMMAQMQAQMEAQMRAMGYDPAQLGLAPQQPDPDQEKGF